MTPPAAPRILLLEDNPLDAGLTVAQLDSAGLGGDVRRVVSREEYLAALSHDRVYDLILADYDLPAFDGFQALQLARQLCPDVPFVFLSGKLGEEHAIDSLRQGAKDYVLKQRIERLVPAVQRALAEARERAERQRAEEALRESELKFRQLANAMPQIVWATREDGYRFYYNQRWYEFLGIAPDNFDPDNWADFLHPDDQARARALWAHCLKTAEPYEIEYRFRRHDGEYRWYLGRALPVRAADGKVARWFGTCTDIHDQKLVQSELRHSREQMEIVVKGANVGVWYCPLPFDKLIWDEKVKEHFHLPPDAEVSIDLFYQRLHPEDVERTRSEIEASIAKQRPYDIDYRTVSPDGHHVKWIRAIGRGFYDSDGRPTRFDGITIDISERVRAEERVREESNTVEAINQVGRSIAAELDLNKLVQSVTDATTEVTGADFGAFFYNVFDADGGSYSLYTLSGISRDEFQNFPMPRNTGIFGPTFRGEGIVRLDDVTLDPRYGANFPHKGMPAGHPPVRSYLAVPVMSRSGEVLGGLFFGHKEAGIFTERHERIVAGIAAQAAVAIDNARLFDSARRANAEKDILLESERAARSEAERASRLKDEFLATLSHELRTPLNAILGWAQLLGNDGSAGEDAREGLRVIERNARTQAQLIEDLLDMSRIISGKVRLDVQRVDLGDVIEAACETVRPASEAKGVRIRKVIDPLAGPVSGDPNRLQQVVWNLLNNAVKFTPRGGKVDLLLQRVNSHVEITVHDTGEGIPPEFLPHVFDRFRQADGTTTRRHGGLGLGLSIVRHLVELHGGTVHAKSPGPGQGATFLVNLPVAPIRPERDAGASAEGHPHTTRRHPTARAPDSKDECNPRLDGVKVLVVDDDPDARDLMRRVLRGCGATVVLAADASTALSLLRRDRPSVLVSDIGMPDHDGYDLIRWVRALPPEEGGRTPAVALTAFARSEDRRKAISAGYQMHLSKPAEAAELVTVVGSLAGVSQLDRK